MTRVLFEEDKVALKAVVVVMPLLWLLEAEVSDTSWSAPCAFLLLTAETAITLSSFPCPSRRIFVFVVVVVVASSMDVVVVIRLLRTVNKDKVVASTQARRPKMSKADRHACRCRNRCTNCRDAGDMGATARPLPRRKTTTLLLQELFLGITVVGAV